MSLMGPDVSPESAGAIPWVRKRDGRIVSFDAAKIASSILAAHELVDIENPAFTAQELTQAVIHFLSERTAGQIPSTSEIAETVVTVLREVGQGPTAQIFHDYGIRRDQLRLTKIENSASTASSEAGSLSADSSTFWDKAGLVERLEAEVDLDEASAREVASTVEHRLIATGLSHLSPGLIDELVYCELFDRGLENRWRRHRMIDLPTAVVENAASFHQEPDELLDWAGREVLRRFALREVYSRDVAVLVEDQLLRLMPDSSPVHFAAMSLSLGPREARFRNIDDGIDYLERRLEESAAQVSSVMAVDSLDAWLALVGGIEADASHAAARVAQLVTRVLRERRVRIIVNLFGQVPADLANLWSKGALFPEKLGELHDRWASDFGTHLANQFKPRAREMNRCRLDVHLDALETTEQLELLAARWLRWSERGLSIAFAFDRPTWSAGEGLIGPLGQAQSVIEYVGIDLGRLLERIGPDDDGLLFVRRLDLLCDSAVRLGLQKREFLRQRRSDEQNLGGAVVFCPLGIEHLGERLTGKGIGCDEAGLSLTERVLRRMTHRLTREAKHYRLECRVDAGPGDWSTAEIPASGPRGKKGAAAAILTAGRMHAAMGGGTTKLRLPESPSMEGISKLITSAARESPTCRLVLTAPPPDRQPRLFD